jgi:hypothetical protein
MGGFVPLPTAIGQLSISPSNPFVVAWDYWKDVATGDPVGTSNGERIAQQAATVDLAAGATQEHAQQTYAMVLAQVTPDVLYPPELKTKLITEVLFASAIAVGLAVFIYKEL